MTQRTLEILPNPDALAARVADLFVESYREATARGQFFSVALAGGTTPMRAYQLLATPERSKLIDWNRCIVFFGDERFVPTDDANSNLGMAQRTLLNLVPIPSTNIFPAVNGLPSAADEAEAYQEMMEGVLLDFDLLLLGLGDDGHTLSLFPGKPALGSQNLVTWSSPGVLPPPVDRITLTFKAANNARRAVFIVSGPGKAKIVPKVLAEGADPKQFPAAGIRPTKGTVTWLLDADAARLLPT